ncbi:MAG: hypothetical protein AB1546_16505, partial [bacterium]
LGGRRDSFSQEVMLAPLDADGIRVEGIIINPASIHVEVGVLTEQSKVVPIVLTTTGKVREPAATPDAELFPSVISILGDKNILAGIESIQTEPFDWRRCESGGVYPLALRIPNNVYSLIRKVTLSCSTRDKSERNMAITIEPMNIKEGTEVQLNPTKMEVVLRGASSTVRKINSADVAAVVDLIGLDEGTHSVVPSAYLKTDIQGVEISSSLEKVEVKITGRK